MFRLAQEVEKHRHLKLKLSTACHIENGDIVIPAMSAIRLIFHILSHTKNPCDNLRSEKIKTLLTTATKNPWKVTTSPKSVILVEGITQGNSSKYLSQFLT